MQKKQYRRRTGRKISSSSSHFRRPKKITNLAKYSLKIAYQTVNRWKKIWRMRRKWQNFLLAIAGMFLFLGMHLISAPPVRASTTTLSQRFTPDTIDPAFVSTLQISFFNSHPTPITGGTLVEDLQGDPTSGIFVANPPNVVIGPRCGGAIINGNTGNPIAAGDTILDISDITVPGAGGGNGRCNIRIDVTSTTPNNNINTIQVNAFNGVNNGVAVTNTQPASATLAVNLKPAPSLSKNFSPSTILINGTSTLNIQVTNNADIDLTNVNLTDNLPTNLTATAVNIATKDANCIGGTVTNTANQVSLSGVTIAPGAVCRVSVDVTSATPGVYNNIIPTGNITSTQGLSNEGDATAILDVQDLNPPSVTKAFPLAPIVPRQNARLTIDINNNSGAVPITGVTLTDTFPAGVFVSDTPNLSQSSDCQGGTIALNPGDTQINVPGITIPPNGTCRIQVNVTADNGGSYTNRIEIGDVTTNEGVFNEAATESILQVERLTLDKQFEPEVINPGDTSQLIITFSNYSDIDIENGDLTDNFPPEIQVASPDNFTSTCTTGTFTIPDPVARTSFTYTNITIPGRPNPVGSPDTPGTCEIRLDVVSNTVAQTLTNTIPPGGLNGGGFINLTDVDGILRVGNDGFDLTKQFVQPDNTNTANIVSANSPFRARLRLQLPINIPLLQIDNVSFTDNLPTDPNPSTGTPGVGLLVANPPNIDFSDPDCLGTPVVNATAGTNTISVSGVTLNRATGTGSNSNTCDIFVNVVGSLQGDYTNQILAGEATATGITMNGMGMSVTVNNLADTSATVRLSGVNVAKQFFPPVISPGGRTTLRVSLINNEVTPINGASLTDNLPQGAAPIAIADPPNASTTCGSGTVSATAGGSSFTLNNGTIPPRQGDIPGLCTFQVDVTGNNPGNATNTIPIGALTSDNRLSNIEVGTATLEIKTLDIGINQSFNPIEVSDGQTSTLTVTIFNPASNGNNVTLLDTNFVANFDLPLIVASPANTSTTCTNGIVTAVSGANSFSFSGGEIPPLGSCTVTVEVLSTQQGNQDSTISVGAATSSQGASNINASIVTITDLGAGSGSGVSVGKAFTPEIIAPGGTSRLSITIVNVSNTNLTNLSITDDFPTGVTTTFTPNATTTCGSGLVQTSTNSVILSGGTLGGGSSCTISVDVTSNTLGDYLNTIDANAVNNDQNLRNGDPTSANLKVTTAPAIAKSYSNDRIAVNTNSTLTISLFNNDTVPISLTTSFVDNLPSGLVVANPVNTTGTTCDVAQLSLSPGGTTITYLGGATIPVNDCDIVVEVTGITQGTKSNTIAIGDLKTTGGQNVAPVSSNIIVDGGPEILLVKRITAINDNRTSNPNGGGDLLNSFIDDPNDPNDNNPNWPDPNIYLRGGINGGPVLSGDEIEYTIYFLSSGTTPASDLQICDVLRDSLNFVSTAFNGSSPQESGSIFGADLGIALAFDTSGMSMAPPTSPTVFLTNNNADSDRGQFFPPLSQPPSVCKSPTNFLSPVTASENIRGSVVVNVVSNSDTVPNSTGSGVPIDSYGFVRFRVKFD